jgi:hypothetical protein
MPTPSRVEVLMGRIADTCSKGPTFPVLEMYECVVCLDSEEHK